MQHCNRASTRFLSSAECSAALSGATRLSAGDARCQRAALAAAASRSRHVRRAANRLPCLRPETVVEGVAQQPARRLVILPVGALRLTLPLPGASLDGSRVPSLQRDVPSRVTYDKEVSSERSNIGFDCTRCRDCCIRADNAPTDNCRARTKRRSTAGEP
jgi:hypothetical protein